jgi:hypothetical protein
MRYSDVGLCIDRVRIVLSFDSYQCLLSRILMHSCMPLLNTVVATLQNLSTTSDGSFRPICMVEVSSSSKSCGIPVPSPVERLNRFHFPEGNRLL